MSTIRSCEVPLNTLLRAYTDAQSFTDCYVAEVPGAVTQADYIEAFYTSPLFKIERTILKYLAAKPATDEDVRQLAGGKATRFSAWRVESQAPSELLLADFTGRTRSWLMATRVDGSAQGTSTLLHFGSAVVPRQGRPDAEPSIGWIFRALLGFHRLYSRRLLSAASGRVRRA